MITCIQIECFMPYFALIIMYYHVKIACYQQAKLVAYKLEGVVYALTLVRRCVKMKNLLKSY